jgi:hypothetical protein
MAPRNAVLENAVAERDRLNDAIDEVLAAAEADDREPTSAERDVILRHRARLDDLEPVIVELVDLEERRDQARDARTVLGRARAAAEPSATAALVHDGPVYRTFAQYARDELIERFDFIAGSAGGTQVRASAAERLHRAAPNTLSSDVPGLIPPQHIAEIFQNISNDRPIVAASRNVSLTSGMITYPSIDQRPTAGKQTAEKTEYAGQKMSVSMKSLPAQTFIGAGDLSWQTVQWSNPDALALWFSLCGESYAGQTEAVVGTLLAAVTPTITVASDDLNGWSAAIAEAAGAIFKNTMGGGNVGKRPNVIAMGADVGFKLYGLVTNQAPVFLNVGQTSLSTPGHPTFGGLQIIISGGLPDTAAVVGDFSALLCAETAGAPVQLRAVEPSIGGFEVGIIGAFAAALADPASFVALVPPAGP